MFALKQFLKRAHFAASALDAHALGRVDLLATAVGENTLFVAFCLIAAFHSGFCGYLLRYPLESRYLPLLDPTPAEPYDAIVVLSSSVTSVNGLVPLPMIDEATFRRLDEAWRLYRIRPRPIVVSGGPINPLPPPMYENQIARDYLVRWGVPQSDVLWEGKSRDAFESAVEIEKILRQKHWKRYLLVHVSLTYAAQHAGVQIQGARADSGSRGLYFG